ncbi:TonB-dependent receptor [Xanthobacter sp. AM11]|uniref:TonB-dependent receptor n=1 Tax=Xanthobacter sp. AM11 TaxID=3380643 RepID=UPI0039BF6AA3
MSPRLAGMLLCGASALSLLSALSATAYGQESADGATVALDTIVVTGEKVERSLDETAASVTVLTAKDIADKFGDNTIREVLAGTPNVYYLGTVGAPIIRGQDTQGPNSGSIAFLSGTVPRATINIDGHYQNFYEYVYGGNATWDVESIEVFRGPQTTSQGANAIAGTIIVNTKDPTFKPEVAYQAEYGSYQTMQVSAMASGPLSSDLAARIAVDYQGRDTFINFVNPAFTQGDTDQDFANTVIRGKLLWQPQAIPGLEAKLTYSYNAGNRPTDESAFAPYADLDSKSLYMPSWDQTTNIGILDVSYDFGNGVKFVDQAQYSGSSVTRVSAPMTNAGAEIEQLNGSNEARFLFGQSEDKWSGMAAVYYANTTSDEVLYYRGVSSFEDTKDNLGIFGETTYRLTDRWSVTGGLRYERDRVQRVGTSSLATEPLDYDQTFDAILPKLSVAYKLTQDVTVGGLVSKGYNPGGVSLNTSSKQWLEFDPETVWDYEIFTRAHFLDNKLYVTGNLFYMDYTNAQRYVGVLLTSGITQYYTINAESAYSYGFELSADYRVTDTLRLTAGLGVVRTQITEMLSNPDYEGNAFQKSPGYTFSAGFDWEALPNFHIAGDVRCIDGYYSDDANTADYEIGAYTIADLRMSYKFNQHAEVYGYAKNIFNERVPTYMQYNRSLGGIEGSMTLPTVLGAGLRGSF